MQFTDDQKIEIVAAVIRSEMLAALIQTIPLANRDQPNEIAGIIGALSAAIIVDTARRIP